MQPQGIVRKLKFHGRPAVLTGGRLDEIERWFVEDYLPVEWTRFEESSEVR